jgi:YggT family protein
MFSSNILVPVLNTLSSILIIIFLLRLILQINHISYLNPIFAFIYKATNPTIKILTIATKEKIPFFIIALISTYIIAFLIQSALFYILPMPFDIIRIALIAITQCFDQFLNVIFFSAIISAISSWVNADPNSHLLKIVNTIALPWLKRIRNLIPQTGRWDFSPLLLLLAINAIQVFIIGRVLALIITF